jgi:hypothetical protein
MLTQVEPPPAMDFSRVHFGYGQAIYDEWIRQLEQANAESSEAFYFASPIFPHFIALYENRLHLHKFLKIYAEMSGDNNLLKAAALCEQLKNLAQEGAQIGFENKWSDPEILAMTNNGRRNLLIDLLKKCRALELEIAGLVNRTVSTPVRFQAVPLSEALTILMERLIKTTSGLMKKIKDLSREAEKKQEKTVSSYVIKELASNENWFGNSPLKLESTSSFDLMTSFDRLASRLNSDAKAFKKAAMAKRTLIRIITDKPPADSPFWELINSLSAYEFFQIRFLDHKPDAVIIAFNKKEAALSLSLDKPPGPPYLFANHPTFLYLALEHFDAVWRTAEPLSVEDVAINRN